MEKNKKYKVTLESWGAHSLTSPVTCDSLLTEKESKKYLKSLSDAFKQVPITSCFLCMEAQFAKKETTSVYFNRSGSKDNGKIKKARSSGLELHLATYLDCTNTEKKCLDNIKEGKCRDTFVIELIGKKLFPTKYAQEKQK